MTITLTCLCGTFLCADENEVGTLIDCPVCGHKTRVPSVQDAPTPLMAESSEEDDIPEMDVEEHVSAGDKKKRREKNRATQQEETDEEDAATTKASSFASRLKAAGYSWATIGSIRLDRSAGCVALGPGGAWGLASEDDDVIVFNMLKGKRFARFYEHDESVTCIAISSDGEFALSGDAAGDIVYWVVGESRTKRRLLEHEDAITALAFSAAADYAASGDRKGGIRLWKLASSKDRALADCDWGEKITDVAFSPDGNLLLAAGGKGHLNVWSVKSGDRKKRFHLDNQPIACARFSAKADQIFAAIRPSKGEQGIHPTVWRLNVETGEAQECFSPTDPPTAIPQQTLLDQVGKRLIIAGTSANDGADCLEIWSLATARRLHAFTDVKGAVESFAVTPNCTRLLASLVGRRLQVFAMPSRAVAP